MKRIIIKLRLLSALFILLGITKIAYSQTPTYQLYFTNVQHPANNVVVWDAYLLRTGTTPLQLAAIQFGFGYDISILNGGTLTASIDAGFSDLPVAMQPASTQSGTINYTGAPVPSGQTHRYINVAARSSIGAGNGPLISNADGGCGSKGTRIGRFRITNSVPFAPNSKMNQVFSEVVGYNRTRTAVFANVGGRYTDITVIANHFSYNVPGTCDLNIVLNPVATCALTGSSTITAVSCYGISDGTAEITLTGAGAGVPGTYTVDGGASQPFNTNPFTVNGLSEGEHTIVATVTSGNCSTTPIAVFIGLPGNFHASYVKTNISACNILNDGTITVTATGGTAPYSYLWSGGYPGFAPGNVASVNNLMSGYYNVTITDATGCGVIVLSNINIQPASTVYIQNTSTISSACGNNGLIKIDGVSGVQPYTYSINGTSYQANNIFIGVATGYYTCYIKDALGCIATKPNIFVDSKPLIIEGYTWDASSCNTDGVIGIYLNSQIQGQGVPPYSYSLDGITYQASHKFRGMPAGTYTAYMKDSKGCIGITEVIVKGMAPIAVAALHTNTSTCMNDGTIRLQTLSGGISPYTYSLDGINYQANNLFTGLAAGVYNYFIKDSKGCTGSTSVTIGQNKIILYPQVTAAGNCAESNGSIRLYFTGGVGPFTYSLNGTNYQASNLFTGLSAGTYTGYVKDSKGCTGQKDIVVGPVNCAPPVANNAKGNITSAVTPSVSSLLVHVYPNPGIDEFTLVLSGYNMNEKVSVIVTEIMGRKVYFSEGAGKQQYKFGRSFLAGLYNLQVIQGTNKKSVKLVKE